MTRVHQDWATGGFALPPVADLTGPFPRRSFLEAWWRHRAEGEPAIAESATALVPGWLTATGLEFLGEPDLTDYHSPLGTGVEEAVADLLAAQPNGKAFRFDSLPEEAAEVVLRGAAAEGRHPRIHRHALAAVIDLAADYDGYLAGLDAKDRHEVRRKQRRFREVCGEARLVDLGPEGLATFAKMHRASPGPKGGFLSERMEAFFADLLDLPGASLDFLVTEDGDMPAAAFGFRDERAYYLYNSAFDRGARGSSPGILLVDLLVQRSIAEGRERVDLLKGDEDYKFRLGARARPLFSIEGTC